MRNLQVKMVNGMSEKKEVLWIARDYLRCSGCRLCEIACSLSHEGRIWPEASRIRVFMLIPGVEVPHLCAQCDDYPCVKSCSVEALSVDEETGAVLVDDGACTACGSCIEACPGRIPHMHPTGDYVVICDLCRGEPKCVEACASVRCFAIWLSRETKSVNHKLFARTPEEFTADLALNIYGEKGEELIRK